jgi:hypothetical protein
MNLNPGIEAVRKLAHLGYRFTVDGETIKGRYEGRESLDPAQMRPLLEMVKAHKPEVIDFLRCYCPKCGGVTSCPNYEGQPLCMTCDWSTIVKLYPALDEKRH